MSRADLQLIEQLHRFEKEQIIEAISHLLNSDFIARSIISEIEMAESDKLFNAHEKALTALIAARKAFADWTRDAAEKYGDGKSFKISSLPISEYGKGAYLEKSVEEFEEKERKLHKQINKLLNL